MTPYARKRTLVAMQHPWIDHKFWKFWPGPLEFLAIAIWVCVAALILSQIFG